MRQQASVRTGTRHPILVYAVTVGQSARMNVPGQLAYMRARGYRVILMCTPDDETMAYAREEGVELISLPMKRGYLVLRDLRAFIRAIRVFRQVRPDVVCSATPKAGFIVGLAGMVSRVPARVYDLRGLRLDGERPGSLRYHVLRSAEWVSCRTAHAVVVIGESLRSRAVALGVVRRAKTRILGGGSANGVDLDRFRPVSSVARRDARAERGFPSHATIFGFVGRIVYDKGIDVLIEAFESLPGRLRPKLVLVGGLEEEHRIPPHILARIRTNPDIRLTGFVRDPSAWYRVMNVVVLPSRREGFGTVLLEAAASGLPTVASRATGCENAIQDGVTGILVPVGDRERLTCAMLALADDPAMRERMGAAGREFVENNFEQGVVWSNIANFIEPLARRGR